MRLLLIAISLLLVSTLWAQETCSGVKTLFADEVHLNPAVSFNNPIIAAPLNEGLIVSSPVFRLQQPDRLPVFCAIEKRISQAFKFPVRMRIDDRKYDYR